MHLEVAVVRLVFGGRHTLKKAKNKKTSQVIKSLKNNKGNCLALKILLKFEF